MPTAPPRVCGTCGQVGCPGHRHGPWHHAQPTPRLRGRRLQRLRQQVFAEQPLCVLCAAQDRITAASRLDHRVPLAEGGTDDRCNLQPLCGPCHDAKTQREAARGHRGASTC